MAVQKACNEPGAKGDRSRGEGKASPAERAPGDTAGTGSIDEAQVVELRVRGVCVWYDARPGMLACSDGVGLSE